MGASAGPDGYLEAFMNGFEFVLLAMRGRLQEADLPTDERARIEAFLADYWRIVQAFQARAPVPLRRLPFVAELDVAASN